MKDDIFIFDESGTILIGVLDCSIKSVTIPNNVKSIGDYAFKGCSALTSITIPDSVTYIGNWAFEGCSSLTEVIISNSMMKIKDYAFDSCSGLVSVVLSSKLAELGDKAFINCNALKKVTALGKRPASITEDVFPRRSTQTLYVPLGCTSAYEQAEYWWQFKEIIEVNSQQGKTKGDVNGDGKVNVSDIMRIVNIILGTDN